MFLCSAKRKSIQSTCTDEIIWKICSMRYARTLKVAELCFCYARFYTILNLFSVFNAFQHYLRTKLFFCQLKNIPFKAICLIRTPYAVLYFIALAAAHTHIWCEWFEASKCDTVFHMQIRKWMNKRVLSAHYTVIIR